ncbi:MAG TPA: DegT/DnrJ/EryC1/StrS family aminotransferase [Candidatus Paceibacterota bacterium]|nr:DegT/DnrJ/EryC1/StrS family aminotransferase [Verrucomicrobiota bacterium]HSA10855.1 DegT/DnrJ/EryC1/StrS family aminotransferase [Candidatus Paceibacterota bacterium]
MRPNNQVSRREFIASTSVLLAASQLGVAETTENSADQLALNGGAKAVSRSAPKPRRWGEPELRQLGAAVEQNSLYYWNNQQTKLLMERFRAIYGHKYVQPCSSGSAALHIAVAAAGIAPGDEVITSGITDIGTVIGVLFQQAVPVFADLEPRTGCLDPADVERKITPRTRMIIAVHLAGNPCRLAELKEIADKHKLILVEDCAQAWGTLYRGRPITSVGQISCFSLQDTKHIACGDGGVVTTSEERFGPLLIKFGDKGTNRLNPKDSSTALAANYRITELQAAFVAAQLTRLEGIAAQRARLGNLLTAELEGIPGILTHQVRSDDRCVYWFYMARLVPEKLRCDRATFVKALAAEGASFSAGYIAVPVYGMPMFQNHSFFAGHWPVKECGLTKMDYTQVKCPETEAILKTCLRFGVNEAMDEDYIRSVAKAVRKVAKYYAA